MDNIIVIGGGPAGLIAAATLADGGIRTTVLEAKAELGGRAASDVREGFFLNRGPHALFAGGAGRRELEALGIEVPVWDPVSMRKSVWLRDEKPRRTFGGPRTMAGFARFLRYVASKPADLASVSTADWIATTAAPAARETVAAFVTLFTYVTNHEQLSADVAAQQLRLGNKPGVTYVRGGWQTLVDALAARVEQSGGTIATRSPVRMIERRGDRWTITMDEAQLESDGVIVATGTPGAARSLLGDAVGSPGPEAEMSCLDLGLSRLPRQQRTFALGMDSPVYASRHSPPGFEAGELLSVASYGRQPEDRLEYVADVVQPGWRDELIVQRYLPSMEPVSAIATPQGGGMAGRPEVTVAECPGAFLAGDWVGPEGWLADAALASGVAAARAAGASASRG